MRDQNWLAVFLDFVIVVVGVFIGIQVSNCNDLRNERAAAVAFEQRLRNDLRDQEKQYDAMIEYYRSVRDSRTLEWLDASSGLNYEAFLIDAYRATHYVGIIPFRSTYDELKASGELRLIHPRLIRAVSGTFEPSEVADRSVRFVDPPYRATFRRSIDPELQKILAQACGDNFDGTSTEAVRLRRHSGVLVHLYDCSLDVEPAMLRTAAAALIETETIVPDLRVQIVEYDAHIALIQAQRKFVEAGLSSMENLTP